METCKIEELRKKFAGSSPVAKKIVSVFYVQILHRQLHNITHYDVVLKYSDFFITQHELKGTHTVCFSISVYNVNQMPMSPLEVIFIVKPQGFHVLLGKI